MANKRVRSSRPKTSRDCLKEAPVPATAKPAHLSRKHRELQEQIHRLECFITAAPQMSRQQRLKNWDMVPPLEKESPRKVARRPARRSLHQQQIVQRHRLRLLIEFGFVVAAIAGALGWLNQWFRFLN